ncbi:MAG TPA: hypothetical protein EYP55_02260 [Anaerolineae bacterium]|nr:hypothetical protein [Anaerolineae bacterium]
MGCGTPWTPACTSRPASPGSHARHSVAPRTGSEVPSTPSRWEGTFPSLGGTMRHALICLSIVLLTMMSCGPPSGAEKIVFESERDGNGEIYIMNNDGSDPVNLTNNPAWDGLPSWSPDGQRIVFTSERSGNAEVWVMDRDGGNVTPLTRGEGVSVGPAWSPAGDRIAFASNRTYYLSLEGGSLEVPGNMKIWVMGADGTNPVRWTEELGLDFYPSWSPDGQKIAFMSVRDGNGEIYVVSTEGGEVNLTRHPAEDWSPAWSPDGQTILFMSDRDGNKEIYVMNADGSDPVNLTNHPANDGDPAWSPDGRRIVFISDRDGDVEIYVMNRDGTEQTRLTFSPGDDLHPSWTR